MITIYGKDDCYWCKQAVSMAKRHSLEYTYKNTTYETYRTEMFKQVPDAKTVPQIFWHERYIGGYNQFATEIENTLGGNFGQELF